MNDNTKQFLLWVDSNEGLTYLAEKTAQGYEREKGEINTDTALGFMAILLTLFTKAMTRLPEHPAFDMPFKSDSQIIMQDVNIKTCEPRPVAEWMQRFTGKQGVS